MSNLAADDAAPIQAVAPDAYAPYGQLVKMLLPRAGSLAIYGPAGDLLWCSDGYERIELKELADRVLEESAAFVSSRGSVRTTSAGTAAFVYVLKGRVGELLGAAIIETPTGEGALPKDSMIASLLRPVFECLQNHLEREQSSLAMPTAAHEEAKDDLELLLAIDGDEQPYTRALERLIEHCVEHLDCVSGVLLIPEKNITAYCSKVMNDDLSSTALGRTHKHLLAWVQLNNRPMVINRVSTDARSQVPPYKLLSCPVRDAYNRVIGLIALFRAPEGSDFELRDIRILEFVSRKAVNVLVSRHDALTGLLNRSIFERHIQEALDQDAAQDASHALLYIDMDKLQLLNETFGFQAGDQVLARAGELLRSELQPQETAARLGGDRFAVFLRAVGLEQAAARAEQLGAAIAQSSYLNGEHSVPVSAAIGVTLLTPSSPSVTHALADAENACKRAKAKGRGRIELQRRDGSDDPGEISPFAMAGLQDALRNNDFYLDAQPIQGLSGNNQHLGWEILLRMRNTDGALVAPNKFIAAAQRYNLTPALDRWVLTTALEQIAGQRAFPEGARFMINVSPQSIAGDHFVEFVRDQLRRAAVAPEFFCFEISEGAALAQLQEAERFVRELVDVGCQVALDDFGCGLTSIAHLRRLPVHYLKIDGSLVRRMAHDRLAESIVIAMAQAAKALGILTIAEHVESEVIAARLADAGVDYGQGFHLGRPGSLAQLLDHFPMPDALQSGT